MASVVRILPGQYIHVLDQDTNIVQLYTGPRNQTIKDSERQQGSIMEMLVIPPMHYCAVENPVLKGTDGQPVLDRHGQYKVRHGEREIRTAETHPDPFPLYPNEKLHEPPTPLRVIPADHAIRVRARRDFEGRVAGDEWLVAGLTTYVPRAEEEVVQQMIKAIHVLPNAALRLQATREYKDRTGATRLAGEEWLWRKTGAFVPDVFEVVVAHVRAEVIDGETALHLRAARTFTDVYGKVRKAGSEWLVTKEETEAHICDVHEELVQKLRLNVLTDRQFCVILNPVGPTGTAQMGLRKLVTGPTQFFLQPGEELENGEIFDKYVLGKDQALLLTAREDFDDGEATKRIAGERWMVHGPCEYVPPVTVDVLEVRQSIPLDISQGVYVRDVQSGRVRAQVGSTYMLKANEELWEKELDSAVEKLLTTQAAGDIVVPTSATHTPEQLRAYEARQPKRVKHQVIKFQVPANSAVQLYDYGTKKSRVVFGPNEVMLGPEEQFNPISLSGGRPKRAGVIKTLAISIGPDFLTDEIEVVTSDHAKLKLLFAINWKFIIASGEENKIFTVKDCVGDACGTVGAAIRAVVASSTFDAFHKESARIVRQAVLGVDKNGKINSQRVLPKNGFAITNVDVKSVEPVDGKTREMLRQSVHQAIELTTKSLEASSRYQAEMSEQQAKGELDQQKIFDDVDAEKLKKQLFVNKSKCEAARTAGQARSEAEAAKESARIQGQSDVAIAKTKAETVQIITNAEIERLQLSQAFEIEVQKQKNQIALEKARRLAQLESGRLKKSVDAIGAGTLVGMSRASQEGQAKLLAALGMKGYLITDGSNPVSLLNAASGLLMRHDEVADDSSEL